jgi:hypothetical protein
MNAEVIRGWSAIVVSVLSLITFTGALVVGYFFKDPGLLNLLIGAAIANATTVVNFWLGSSSGSQKKDDIIAASQPVPPKP